MMRWLRFSSLSFQLVSAMLLLTLGLGLIRTYLNRAEVESFAREQFDQRSVATASAFAAYATDVVLTDDLFRLNELISDALLNNPDLRYILVLDANDRVLAHSFGRSVPKGIVAANRVAVAGKNHLQRISTEEGFVLDVAAPLLEGKIGVVRVGMSERAMNADIDRHTWNLMLVTLLSLLPVFITAYLLARVLARPLEKLVAATGAVARGDFTPVAPIAGQEEIAQLGNSFNAMTHALARSQGELQTSNAQLRERNEELAALNTLATAISHSADVDALLTSALDETLRVTNLTMGWIVLRDGENLSVLATRQVSPELAAQLASCDCACDMRSAACVAHDGQICATLAPRAYHALVPLVSRARGWGALHLACADADYFGADLLRLLTAMGQQIGLAIENLELAQAQRREQFHRQLLDHVIQAQEEERKRIARELHDEFAQSLTALIVGLQTHEQTLANDAPTHARLTETRILASQILDQTRQLMFDLRPSVLDDAGLAPALRSFAERACATAKLALDFQVHGARRRLASQSETALFRIVQEAVNNIVQHAHANHVTIVLRFETCRIAALVEDDGIGFDTISASRAGTMGLLGMRERAELVGGRLEIDSRAASGTRVQVEIPT
ncbi:MAG: HAMP domain-containing protein [Chloroflexi bacterium]|nr:HAMP domain-containing protein [Chloroflexota bacterium]